MSQPTVETEALHRAPLFAGLSSEDLQGILRVAEPTAFEPGEAIVEKGEPGDAMFVVTSGTAEVDVGGRYHKLGAGDFFGEMALISETKRMATVKAADPVRALRIPADGFRSFVLEHPEVALSMMRALVERLREVEQRLDAWMGT